METPRLPLSLTPPTPELETLVELLVDDELDADQRRALLERLDAVDGGWKYCATAFLEAQTFRKAFRFLAETDFAQSDDSADFTNLADFADSANAADAAARQNGSPVRAPLERPLAASRRDLPEPRIIPLNASASRGGFRRPLGSDGSGGGSRRFVRFAATTAGFLLSVAFGALLYRQIAPTAPPSSDSAPLRFETGADFAAVATPPASTLAAGSSGSAARTSAAPIRYVTLRSPSRSLDDVAVPCVEGDLNDLATLRASRANFRDVPPPIAEALQTPGGRVQTIRDELLFPLDDGRTIILPVDVYEIRNNFAPIY